MKTTQITILFKNTIFFLVLILLLQFTLAETLSIDKRVRSEENLFMVSFISVFSESGHSFVAFLAENEEKLMTEQAYFGYYALDVPANSFTASFEAFIGLEGSLLEETLSTIRMEPAFRLDVLVNSDQYQVAIDLLSKWRNQDKYQLLFNDCVTFTDEVAESIGLTIPSRVFNPTPNGYLEALIDSNRP